MFAVEYIEIRSHNSQTFMQRRVYSFGNPRMYAHFMRGVRDIVRRMPGTVTIHTRVIRINKEYRV